MAAFAVAGCAHEALGTRVAARTGAAAPAGSGSGFFDFATEVAAGVERCRRDRVDKVITESLAILVAGDE